MYKSGLVVALALILFALQDLSLSQPFRWRIKCCGALSVVGRSVNRFLLFGGWQCRCLQGQDRLTLKMKALPSFEMLTYPAKLRDSPEKRNAGTYRIFCTDSDVNP